MSGRSIQHIVFIKKWQDTPLPVVAEDVRDLGFDGVELPVRDGFWVEPQGIAAQLPGVVQVLADQGLKVGAVAGEADEATVAALGDSGVPILRIMVPIPPGRQYLARIEATRRHWDTLLPALERHRVTLGVQNHCGRYITDALGLYHAINAYDPKLIGAVWDPAHNALQGDNLDLSLDLVWSHLCMVNMKSAFWRRTSAAEAPQATWRHHWTTGPHGMVDWPAVIADLTQRGYERDISFSAEYSGDEPGAAELDGAALRPLLAADLAYIKGLLAR